MKIGITGLKASGKTTIFNALTSAARDYSSDFRESNIASVKVPDSRLERLYETFKPQKKVNTTIDFFDVRGIEKSDETGKGFSTDIITNIKICDALLPVIRVFKDEIIPHSEGAIDPLRDIELVNTELMISDMSILEARIEKLERLVRLKNDPSEKEEYDLLMKCKSFFDQEIPLREAEFLSGEDKMLRGFQFLTQKPLIYVLNIDEDSITGADSLCKSVREKFTGKNCEVLALCGKIEEELTHMDDEEAEMFRQEYGIEESAIQKLIRYSYDLLGLISFFTMVEKEVKSWTIPKGISAKAAAGVIHTDMEKGFVKAEVISVEDLLEHGSLAKCREKGILRLEGKEYVVQDGDFITFKFGK